MHQTNVTSLIKTTLIAVFAVSLTNTFEANAQLPLRIFSDISYQVSKSDQGRQTSNNGAFKLGQFDMFVAYNLGNNLDVLSKLVF